jgi:adenosine deaminase
MSPTSYRTAPPRGAYSATARPVFPANPPAPEPVARAANPIGVHTAEGYSLDAAVHALPKLHLHCHLEGTTRPQTFRDLALSAGVTAAEQPYEFDGFPAFLATFMAVCRSLRAPEDYARIAREFVHDARAQNVVYGEIFVSPSAWSFFHPDLDVEEALHAIARELRVTDDAPFSLIVDVTRNLGPVSAMQTVELAASLKECGVVGIGLGGDEARFPAELFAGVFEAAREAGLHTVAHAGEAASAQSVRAAVEVLGAERIGHGVRALEDPGVVSMLAQREIALEMCPTSNFLTGAADRDRPHPIFALAKAGVPVVVDADDPALFGTSIEAEYRYVAQHGGIELLRGCVATAIDKSFASGGRKRALRAALEEAV